MYVTAAVSRFGLPAVQAAPAGVLAVPCAGAATMVKESSHVSASVPLNVIATGVSCAVVTELALAAGAVFPGGGGGGGPPPPGRKATSWPTLFTFFEAVAVRAPVAPAAGCKAMAPSDTTGVVVPGAEPTSQRSAIPAGGVSAASGA